MALSLAWLQKIKTNIITSKWPAVRLSALQLQANRPFERRRKKERKIKNWGKSFAISMDLFCEAQVNSVENGLFSP